MSTDLTANDSPWHAGEVWMQEQLGVAEKMKLHGGRAIRSFLPEQHRSFFSQLPFAVIGSIDSKDNPWATIVSGTPGFIQTPSNHRLDLTTKIHPTDPAADGLSVGGSVGLLGIELHTRRRNRVNGIVSDNHTSGFSMSVVQSFGNCPRYIQCRDVLFSSDAHDVTEVNPEHLAVTDSLWRDWVTVSDTFFVSSFVDLDDGRQVDVSHRGGKPGFVKVDEDGTLIIPDYAGNKYFNTLGNFIENPKAGLIFPDFETGDMLQLTGTVEIILESPEIDSFEGAERLWTVKPSQIVLRRKALPLKRDA